LNPLGLFLEPPGPLLTHLHTVYMAYSECLPTRLNLLAERTRFSQVDTFYRNSRGLTPWAVVARKGRHCDEIGRVFESYARNGHVALAKEWPTIYQSRWRKWRQDCERKALLAHQWLAPGLQT
jgi:hypothetical protein